MRRLANVLPPGISMTCRGARPEQKRVGHDGGFVPDWSAPGTAQKAVPSAMLHKGAEAFVVALPGPSRAPCPRVRIQQLGFVV
jgi:hypothetical protein